MRTVFLIRAAVDLPVVVVHEADFLEPDFLAATRAARATCAARAVALVAALPFVATDFAIRAAAPEAPELTCEASDFAVHAIRAARATCAARATRAAVTRAIPP